MRNASFSPNIKDRLDMSTAIMDGEGRLVAQAEHIPVHLGSMSIGVKNLLTHIADDSFEDGDVLATNDPYISGTHLNDVMMISPVFFNGKVEGYVASKAHYVDIGGTVPGSLSASATEIYQEGMILAPIHFCREWEPDKEVLTMLTSNVRTPDFARGDSLAQVAALRTGVSGLSELFAKYGRGVTDAWSLSLDYVEAYTRNLLSSRASGEYRASDLLELEDRDVQLFVTLKLRGDELEVDFSGSDRQVEAPINAVFGVTVSATSYALKAALDPELPFNYGFLRPVHIYAPLGSILNPERPAPVSAGNVETSQRVADVVLRALASFIELPAASQGTMNNIMLGGSNWAFYETIGGGSGGRPDSDGVDGVQVNMTNTLNTPVETIEATYPLRVVSYELRENSGGRGLHRGGNGIIREILLLKETTVTVVGDRRRHGPWGLKGGEPGQTSYYSLVTKDDEIILGSKQSVKAKAGSILRIFTPGGGGYGALPDAWKHSLQADSP